MKRFTLALTALAARTLAPFAVAEGAALDVTITGMETRGMI